MNFLEIVQEPISVKRRLRAMVRVRKISGPETVWEYLQNNMSDYESEMSDWTWIVAGDLSLLTETQIEKLASQKVLLGPNVHFDNPEISKIVRRMRLRKIIAPSEWVADYFDSAGIENRDKIVVWASTVDPNEWTPLNGSRDSVLIYLKDFSQQKLVEEIADYFSSKNIRYSVLNYGHYSKRDFKRTLNSCSWAIWIGGTESQGLAMLESWFMNVPTLVLESNVFTDLNGSTFPASSAPYLSTECGCFFSLGDDISTVISTFQSGLQNYSPRKWALKNFSHENVMRSLMDSLTSNQ